MTSIDTFWDALNLDAASPPVVAIVGGGGKTSLLFRLGREAEARGCAAVLTGTTRFTTPPPLSTGIERITIDPDAGAPDLNDLIARKTIAVVHAGIEPKSRWTPLGPGDVDALAATPGLGLIAIEADGSKMLPFKAPADHEPVIPDSATHVVAVVGLKALDTPLDNAHVHRPDHIRSIVRAQARATSDVIARVLNDERGGRKNVGERDFTVLVNQADLDPERARQLAQAIRDAGAPRVIVAALHDDEEPIQAILD